MNVTDDQRDETIEAEAATSEEPPQYGVGPFTVREVAIIGLWVIAFVVSFFSVVNATFLSVWTSGIDWILPIGVPTVAVFLLVLRRLSPSGIPRVGSLGIDQFASVAFSVAAVVWLTYVWNTLSSIISGGIWFTSWVVWVEFVAMLALVVLTVFAPLIPTFAEDFRGRREIPAHRNARPIRPVTPRPAPAPSADAAQPDAAPGAPVDYDADPFATDVFAQPDWAPENTRETFEPAEPVDSEAEMIPAETEPATREIEPEPQPERVEAEPAASEPHSEPVRTQAFWALAPEERDVVDDRGVPIFRIGPTAWALVIEERDEVFVVRHEDGRVGYLHDVSDVTRG